MSAKHDQSTTETKTTEPQMDNMPDIPERMEHPVYRPTLADRRYRGGGVVLTPSEQRELREGR